MQKLVDKNLIFLMTALLLLAIKEQSRTVVIFLLGIAITEFTVYFFGDKKEPMTMGIWALIYAAVAGVFYPFVFFIPVVLYDVLWNYMDTKKKGLLAVMLTFAIPFGLHVKEFSDYWQLPLWMLTVLFSLLLAFRSSCQLRDEKELIHLRDNSVEFEMSMKNKNKALMEKQDYEIHVATLQERNRIARDIHDNVGHMLSRSILQMGALMMIHKEEPLHSQLASVSDSLNEAMNNIRESVHDLHDASLDLQQAVLEATNEMRRNYHINLEYDVTADVPRNVKYCMISIVKEAMSNVVKHSNGNQVTIILREHPAFFQLFIGDNGILAKDAAHLDEISEGIGLSNMRSRVETIGGIINFKYDNGFQIHVTIKREQN